MKDRKALIVDDVSIMRVVLKDTLAGYCHFERKNLFDAAGGREALTVYKNEKPNIVFLDIAMPGMDGLETVRELRKLDPDAKVVMCTSSADQSDVLECIKSGAVDYITKPPEPKRILQAVEKVLGKFTPDFDPESDFDPDYEPDENATPEAEADPDKEAAPQAEAATDKEAALQAEAAPKTETEDDTAALKEKIAQLEAQLKQSKDE